MVLETGNVHELLDMSPDPFSNPGQGVYNIYAYSNNLDYNRFSSHSSAPRIADHEHSDIIRTYH